MIIGGTETLSSTDLQILPANISTTDNFNVSVTVQNTGSVDGKEVVQVRVDHSIFDCSSPCFLGLSVRRRKLCSYTRPAACRIPKDQLGVRLFLLICSDMNLPDFFDPSNSAGSSQTVSIEVQSEQLAVWNLDNEWEVEPGVFTVQVGTSAEVFATADLTVT